MAANMWKLTDVYSRVFYYEDEKRFLKRFKAVLLEEAKVLEYHKRNGTSASSWCRKPAGYRMINDAWVEQEYAGSDIQDALIKAQEREHKAAMRREMLRKKWEEENKVRLTRR